MNRADFGKLIAALRKEHEDEQGIPWTQERLAQEANLVLGKTVYSEDVISSIERGRHILGQDILQAFAGALQLTSGERKEFFLAASGVENEKLARVGSAPEKAFAALVDMMKEIHLPCYITDCYCDVIAIDYSVIELMDFLTGPVALGTISQEPLTHNLVRLVCSPDGAAHLGRIMGDDFPEHLLYTLMLFRRTSLRYRSTAYFELLLKELKKHRLFKRCWYEAGFREADYFVDNRCFHLESVKWGRTVYCNTYVTALTSAGELSLCVHTPMNEETAATFSEIMQQTKGAGLLLLGAWPHKDPARANDIRVV